MKRCRTPEEFVRRFGKPDHKLEQQGVAIWHYPPKAVGGNLYAIHVAILNGALEQVYLYIEPLPGK